MRKKIAIASINYFSIFQIKATLVCIHFHVVVIVVKMCSTQQYYTWVHPAAKTQLSGAALC